jgi:glutamyl-tRNA synthetase
MWDDGIRGSQKFDAAQLSDPVIRRADGSWLYMMPSAVDDIDMGVTQVLRGEDHVSNTAVQIQIFTALYAADFAAAEGAAKTLPAFAHEALLVGREGKLSKRLGSLGCDSFRERGIEPEAIISLLARLGTSQPVEPVADRSALVESFDLSTFGRAPAKFDEEDLERLNAGIVHQLPFEVVASRLPQGMDAAGWHAVRPNLAHVGEAMDWWQLVTGPIIQPEFSQEDKDFLAEAARLLVWDENPWATLTTALKQVTGRKGQPLFLPLRQALTGMDHGPDMGEILPLIGEEEARARLAKAAA